MLQDINFWELGLSSALRARLDGYILANFSAFRAKSTRKDPLFGLLFGKLEKDLLTIEGLSVFGTVNQFLSEEDSKFEQFLRHFERVWNAPFVGCLIESSEEDLDQEFLRILSNLMKYKSSVLVCLTVKIDKEKEGFQLSLLTTLLNKFFKNFFVGVIKVPFEVVNFEGNLPGLLTSAQECV